MKQGSEVDKANEGFQRPGKRPNRTNREKGENKVVKPRPVRTGGTGDSVLLTAGHSTFQVPITNVNSELVAENIREFIDNKESRIKVINIEDKIADGWSTK